MNGKSDRPRGKRGLRLQSNQSRDIWMSVGLFALTILSRMPFQSQILYHWDSVNFATAMREFSVAKEQPQPPGYIVYVWLCRLVDVVARDAQTTMVSISIAASALAVVALFYLGRSMYDRRVGLIAALLLGTSPLFWFYGEIALPHTLDALLVIVSVWWLYEVMEGDHRYLYPAIAILAVAAGVRQQTLIFLAPLLLFALRRVGWRRFVVAGVLGVAICLAWFVPLVLLSHGFSNYMRVMGEFARRFQSTTSVFMGGGWWGVGRNVRKLTMYTLFGWSTALVPGLIYAIHAVRRLFLRLRSGQEKRDSSGTWAAGRERLLKGLRSRVSCYQRSIFLLLWMVPAVIFYVVIHMGQQGLVFVFLPALLLLSALGLARLLTRQPRWLLALASVLAALNAGIFCLMPEYLLRSDNPRLLTRAALVNADRYYQDRFVAIEGNFAPESTAILAANWHHVEYYLPDYVRLPFGVVSKWEKGEGSPIGSSRDFVATPVELGLQLDDQGQVVIVVFDPNLMAFGEGSTSLREQSLKHGGNLSYFVLTGDQAFHYGADSFGVQD